jgi:hypothetical protein
MHAVVVRHHALEDRPLHFIGPDSEVWAEGELSGERIVTGSIVWVQPPPDVIPAKFSELVSKLKAFGCMVKPLRPARVDDVLVTERPEVTKPELAVSDARAVVAEICRELALRAGVDPAAAIREAETYLSAVGL